MTVATAQAMLDQAGIGRFHLAGRVRRSGWRCLSVPRPETGGAIRLLAVGGQAVAIQMSRRRRATMAAAGSRTA
jgi:hypothetical protein